MFTGLKNVILFLSACISVTGQLQVREAICNLLADPFRSAYINEQLEDLPEKQVNDLITIQIDEQELVATLSTLDDNIKSGPN